MERLTRRAPALREAAERAARAPERLPAYVHDLAALRESARAVREALPEAVELYYAVKANPEPPLLAALAPVVDGFEVSSGGELAHVRARLPDAVLAFGGPGKTAEEIDAALRAGTHRFHVESRHEARLLADRARHLGAAAANTGGAAGIGDAAAHVRDSRGAAAHVRDAGGAGGAGYVAAHVRDGRGTGGAAVPAPRDSGDVREVDVLLRVNLPVPRSTLSGVSLAMGGGPSPFGLDPAELDALIGELGTPALAGLRLRGVHAHLASGLDAAGQAETARHVVAYALELADRHGVAIEEVNLGGGMAVDYADPGARFDWAAFGRDLAALARAHPGLRLRVEPGRSLTAHSGWYVTEVLDVKAVHGEEFAVLRGGTHHLRTPVTKGHDQPFAVIPAERWPYPWQRPCCRGDSVTLVGQLCTPKDVFARHVPVPPAGLRAGDRIAFAMAGAYAWNISHHDFLMHPPPAFHYLDHPDQCDEHPDPCDRPGHPERPGHPHHFGEPPGEGR
jgi:diaminopimelate decarboxylase